MTSHDYHTLGSTGPRPSRSSAEPFAQPDHIRQILSTAKTIAVVGHSHKPHRASYQVAQYLRHQGYAVYPVNPVLSQIDGAPCYPTLQAVPGPIDIVNVFRRSEFLSAIATDVLALSPLPACVWTQLDIVDAAVAQTLNDAGIQTVMDACIKIEHQKWFG